MQHTDDAQLSAIAERDTEAFRAWVNRVESRIRSASLSFDGQLDIEVVVQETLLRCWQAAPSLVPDGHPEVLLRFALRVLRNLAISQLRARRSRPEGHVYAIVAIEVGDLSPQSPELPDPHLRKHILACRCQLPAKPAAALDARLSACGRRCDLALSRSLGMTKNTFLQNFGRARRMLRDCLEARGIELSSTGVALGS